MDKLIEEKYLINREVTDCSPGYSDSRTLNIDDKIFLKIDEKNELYMEYLSLLLFHNIGIAPKPIEYVSSDKDYLIIDKVDGDIIFDYFEKKDSTYSKFLGKCLRKLHDMDVDLNILNEEDRKLFLNKTKSILEYAQRSYKLGVANEYILSYLKDNNLSDMYSFIIQNKEALIDDTIIHGDFSAKNIFVKNDELYKVIDTGESGLTDRHIDIAFSLFAMWMVNGYNYDYEIDFLNAYGNDLIDEKRLLLCKKISSLYYVR